MATSIHGLVHFVPGDSFLHRLDPRAKLFCLLILLVAAFAAGSLIQSAILLIFVLLLFSLSNLSMAKAYRNVLVFAPLFIITFAIHFFGHSGQDLFEIPIVRLAATVEGLLAGVIFTLRMISLMLILGLFMATTPPQDVADALERMARPLARLGLPVSQGALTISIALRFVPILTSEADRIRGAQASRGAMVEGAAVLRLHRIAPILLPLFAGALKRADDLALALEARGYRGSEGRTKLRELRFGARDGLAIFLSLIFCVGIWIFY